MSEKFPFRFFVVTFLWTWLLWLPFVLAGLGVLQLSDTMISSMTMPMIGLGAFGPAVGAFVYSGDFGQ